MCEEIVVGGGPI